MRDINRIDRVTSELAILWKAQAPDWRLGQLFCNLQRYYGSDLFYVEDDRLIEKIKEFFNE